MNTQIFENKGCLQLVDLAGSERLDNTLKNIKDPKEKKVRREEASSINSSLSSLKRCFEYLLDKSKLLSYKKEMKKAKLSKNYELRKKELKRKKPQVIKANYRSSLITQLLKEAFEHS